MLANLYHNHDILRPIYNEQDKANRKSIKNLMRLLVIS